MFYVPHLLSRAQPTPRFLSARYFLGICCAIFLLLEIVPSSAFAERDRPSRQRTAVAADEMPTGQGWWEGTKMIFRDMTADEAALDVPLIEVVLLVLIINVFALFRNARLIMATSYLFALKWVFWSNYTELLKHSSTMASVCGYIFVLCGILTAVFFCLDRFNTSG